MRKRRFCEYLFEITLAPLPLETRESSQQQVIIDDQLLISRDRSEKRYTQPLRV
jgi:hypothetical protein